MTSSPFHQRKKSLLLSFLLNVILLFPFHMIMYYTSLTTKMAQFKHKIISNLDGHLKKGIQE